MSRCGLSRECAVVLRTTKGCGLGISVYPDFVYNAEGGGGSGKAVKLSDGCWRVQFDATEINIPDVSFRTTKLLSVPIPPPIRIKIVPDTLEGTVDLETGKVSFCPRRGLFIEILLWPQWEGSPFLHNKGGVSQVFKLWQLEELFSCSVILARLYGLVGSSRYKWNRSN